MKQIPLNVGRWKRTIPTKFALVDNRDFALVSGHKWTAAKAGNYWYAHTMVKTERGWRPVKIHQMILGFPNGLIDHRNLNGLDNRRRNLRLATKGQNAANSPGHRDRKAKHKGVTREQVSKNCTMWRAQLRVAGAVVLRKRFKTAGQAARAYRAAVKLHCGKFGRTR